MFPQWARAYSFMMTQAKGSIRNPIRAAAGDSKTLDIIIGDTITINGKVVDIALNKLRKFLKREVSKYSKITITKNGTVYRTENDLSKPKSRTKFFIGDRPFKSKPWLDDLFGNDAVEALLALNPVQITSRASTVSQEEKTIEGIEGQLQCLEVEDLVRPVLKHNASNKIQVIESDGRCYYLRLSDKKDSALLCELLEESEIKLRTSIPEKKELIIDGNKLKLATKVDCSQEDHSLSSVPKYIENRWNGNFRTNDDPGFRPTSYQFIPLKYAGNKLLLCHRPGFGKTINSILIAERMRNSMPDPKPKILLVIPGKKLLKQWVDVLKSMNRDLSNYIWMTYDIFRASTTGNTDTSYPPYERIDDRYIERLNDFISWYQNGGPKPEKLSSRGLQRSNVNQKNIIYCKLCGKAYSFGANPPRYIDSSPLSSLDLELDDIENIKRLKSGRLVHRVWVKNNDYSDIRFTWDLDEDRILFHCNCIGTARFITGFTPSDIEYSATITTWDQYRSQFGPLENNPPVKDKNYYLYREHQQYKAFEAYKNSLTLRPIVDKNLRMNYIEQKGFVYHQYRPPPGCILVCDEIHKYVRSKNNVTMQCIWKYSLNTQFSIFLTATPLEGSDYFKQVHYLSEMLKMKREYTSDLYLKDTKYEGFPPWHVLQPIRKYKNVYDLTSLLKNKFSRHNTVDNISESVQDLYKSVSKGNEKKYEMDATNLMALYTAKPLDRWVEKKGRDDGFKIEDGRELYQFQDGDKETFVKKALESIYRKKVNIVGVSEFPVLINKPDEDVYLQGKIKNGIYNINLDYHRANMVWNTPNLELRFDSGRCDIDLDEDGYIRVTKESGGEYNRQDIRRLQTAILCNRIPERGVYLIYPEKGYPSAPVVSSYGRGSGLPEIDCPDNYTLDLNPKVLGEDDDLKWLYVHPTKKLKMYDDTDVYNGIPYIPDLLGSKILHIVMTIEDAIRNGKNVMVYHERVELIRAVQRGLTMRRHQFKNATIRTLTSPIENPEEGDYDMSPLLEGAKTSARRRFKTLPLAYRLSQNRDFKYGFTEDELKQMEPDYNKEEWHAIYNDIINGDDFIHCSYKYFYKKYESSWEGKDFLKKAKHLAEFAQYADVPGEKQEVKDYLQIVDYAPILKNVTKGKLTYEKRVRCISAMKLYSSISTKKEFQKLIVGVCKPYYETAKQEILVKIKNKKFKDTISNIDINKLVGSIEEYNIEDNPFRDYYFSKWSGDRFRSTYKKLPYKVYAENRPKTETRDQFSMPDLDFVKWNRYITDHKAFFDKAKQIKMPGRFYIQQMDLNKELREDKFPEKIASNRDFFNLYKYVDQYFLQKSYEFITQQKVMNVENKTMDQLSQHLIEIMDNPKFSDIKGISKLTIGKTTIEQKDVALDRLRSRWTGMTSDTITFGVLEGDSVKSEEYPKFVQAFSQGYVDCLLVSGAGIEGIDYKSCSPSLMICIDPVKTAGKKDQFNGRTVRKKSHHSLPENMRIVEEVTFSTKPYSIETKYEPADPADQFEGKTDSELRQLKSTAISRRRKDAIDAELIRRRDERNTVASVEQLQTQVVEIEAEITGSKRISRTRLTDLVNELNDLTKQIRRMGTEGYDRRDTVEEWIRRLGRQGVTITIERDERQDPREDKISAWNAYFDTYVNLSHVLYTKNLVFISPDEYIRHKKIRDENENPFKYFCHVCEQEDDLDNGICKSCGATILQNGNPVYYHLMPIKGFIQPNDKIKLKNERSIDIANTNRVERDIVEMALSLQSLEHQTKLRGDHTTKIEIIQGKKDLRKKWYYRRVMNPSITTCVDERDWHEQVTSPDKDKYKRLCDLYKSEEVTPPVPDSSPPSFNFSIGDRVKILSDRTGNWSRGIIESIEYDVSPGWNGYYYKIKTSKGVKWSEVWNDKDMELEEEYASDVSIEEEY